MVFVVLGRDAENDCKHVLRTSQLLKRDAYLVAPVKLEIKSQHGFRRSDRTRKVFALLAGFQNSQVGVEQVDASIDTRSCHRNLRPPTHTTQEQDAQTPA